MKDTTEREVENELLMDAIAFGQSMHIQTPEGKTRIPPHNWSDMKMRTLEDVVSDCADHIDTIATFFKGPVEVTLIVRTVGNPEQDFMLTNDSPAEIRALLDRRFGK